MMPASLSNIRIFIITVYLLPYPSFSLLKHSCLCNPSRIAAFNSSESSLVIPKVDLKTTADLDGFRWSSSKYNYDSQAYIYQQIFGYDMLFIAVDKNTHQIGIFDCSPQFLERGREKVMKAIEAYNLFYNDENFEPKNHFINETL